MGKYYLFKWWLRISGSRPVTGLRFRILGTHFLAQLCVIHSLKSNMFPSFAVSDRRGQRRDRLRERAEEGEAAAAAQGQRRQGLRDEEDPPRQDREARRNPASQHARPGKLK